MIGDLKYRLIDRSTDRGEWLEKAAPYGGHMKRFNMLPPLFELNPDYLIVADNLKHGLQLVRDALESNSTAYFHLKLNDHAQAMKDLNEPEVMELLANIEAFEEQGKQIMYLPAHATLFYLFEEESNKMVVAQIFDYGELSDAVAQTKIYKKIHKVLSKCLKREYMIWSLSELDGPMISTVWSKRVVIPKEIVSALTPSKESAYLNRRIRQCEQPFKRRINNVHS